MPKKRKSPEQRQAELRHSMMQASGYIRERYPMVKAIDFDFTYEDVDQAKIIKEERFSWGPSQPAFFQFNCPLYECVNGGFNLSPTMTSLISERRTADEGTLRCQGWQDRERVGKYHCECGLKYKIKVTYEQ